MKMLGLIVLLTIIAAGSYFFISQKRSSPLPTSENNNPPPTIDTSDLRAGGSSFSDPQGVYVILYPADYKLDTQDSKHIRIYKTGATQQGQTEIYDGVIVVFETITLDGQTLSTWVDNNLKTATADGTSKIVEAKKSITHNTYSGFTYSLQGLGTAKYYVLQKNTDSNYAVVITTSVNDPQNVGFQKEVDKTLSTLELLK